MKNLLEHAFKSGRISDNTTFEQWYETFVETTYTTDKIKRITELKMKVLLKEYPTLWGFDEVFEIFEPYLALCFPAPESSNVWTSVDQELPKYKQGVLWLVKRAFGKYTTYHLSDLSEQKEAVEYGISLHHLDNTDILVCSEETNKELNLVEYATHWMSLPPADSCTLKNK